MLQGLIQVLGEKSILTGIILSLLLLSIICQIIIGVKYQKLIRETENLSTTGDKQLKTFKLKFQNCYKMNGGVPNISVFVDKFISRLSAGHISLSGLKQIASQLVMLSVLASGIGACIGIIEGEILLRIIPFYIMGIAGLYLYFSVSALVDVQRRKENLKIHLMDYLENHMLNRLKNNIMEDETIEASVQKEGTEKTVHKEVINLQEIKKAVKEAVGALSLDNMQNQETNKENKEKSKEANKDTYREPKHISEKDLKAAIAAFSEDEIEDLLKELMA